MKVEEILLVEMAKSKSKREREAKKTRKRNIENPQIGAERNFVAKYAQTTGAGAHKDKKKYSRKIKHRNMDY